MKFTPKYGVMYKGKFHTGNVAFEIDPKDANEMTKHGTVEQTVKQTVGPAATIAPEAEIKPSDKPKQSKNRIAPNAAPKTARGAGKSRRGVSV